MDLEFINIRLTKFMREIGKMIKYMDKESLYGVMGINMKVNFKIIQEMDLEF